MIYLENFNTYKGNIVYSACFVIKDDKYKLMQMFPQVHENIYYHHSTIEFKPKDISNIDFGITKEMKILGRLTTDKVDVIIVDNKKSKNKFPHITLSTSNGIKPFESNTELEKYQNDIEWFNEPKKINIIEGIFNGIKDIIKI